MTLSQQVAQLEQQNVQQRDTTARRTKPTLHINGISINPVLKTIEYQGIARFDSFKRTNHRFDIACRLIIGPPTTTKELFETMFGDDAEGGPLGGHNYVHVMLTHLRHKLYPIKLKFYKAPNHRDGCYRQTWIAP